MWKKLAIAGAVGAAILGSGAVALAATGTTSTPGSPVSATPATTSASPTSTTAGGKGTGGRAAKIALRLRGIEHAQWVTKGKDGDVTHDAVDGVVSAVSPTSIKITAADGFSATYVVNSATKVHVKGGGTAISAVAVNDRALVAGVQSGTTITANHIIDAGPKR